MYNIYILNQDLTKFYKALPPGGDFSIAPQLKLRRADRQRGHIVMVKTYIFHRRFSNISHHTIIILCVWFREGGILAPSIGQPPLDAQNFRQPKIYWGLSPLGLFIAGPVWPHQLHCPKDSPDWHAVSLSKVL